MEPRENIDNSRVIGMYGGGGGPGTGGRSSYNYMGSYSIYANNPGFYGYMYGTQTWMEQATGQWYAASQLDHALSVLTRGDETTQRHRLFQNNVGNSDKEIKTRGTDYTNGSWTFNFHSSGFDRNTTTAGGGNMTNYIGKGVHFGLHMANSFAAPLVNTFTSVTFPLINQFNIMYKEGLHEGPAYDKTTNISWLKPYRLTEDWKLVGIDGAITGEYTNGQTEQEELMYLANSTIKTILNIFSLRVHVSPNIFKDYAMKFGFKIPFYNSLDNIFYKPKPKKGK